MVYAEDEVKLLKDKIQAVRATGRLSGWELQFLADMDDRLQKYGRNTRFSDGQISKLYEILSAGKQTRQNRQGGYPNSPRQWNRDGSQAPRKEHWWSNRVVRDAVVIALFVITGAIYAAFRNITGHYSGSDLVAAIPFKRETRSLSRSEFSVTDGDTIRLRSERRGTRLVGFNAPETSDPECAEEKTLGIRAKARLQQLVSNASLELQRIPCSCAPGTEGTDACNYGRSCAILRANGRDVGEILIAEGLAVRFVCGARSCPPTPRPWCD